MATGSNAVTKYLVGQQPLITALLSRLPALPAMTRAARVDVGSRQRVSAFAQVGTCRSCGGRGASKRVDARCHRLKVLRVHARRTTTEVIEMQPSRDRTHEVFVCEPVGTDQHAAPAADLNERVALVGNLDREGQPARCSHRAGRDRDAFHQPFDRRLGWSAYGSLGHVGPPWGLAGTGDIRVSPGPMILPEQGSRRGDGQ